METEHRFTKKHLILLIAATILYSLILLALVQWLDTVLTNSERVPLGPFTLSIWIFIGIILSLNSFRWLLLRPARLLNKVSMSIPKTTIIRRRASPETGIAFVCLAVLISPAIYALILFLMGMPAIGFYLFVGATVAFAMGWGVYNLRKG
jgi:hypothetical protein